ncbi:MAG: SH3 domain-containing protein [Acidobacteriota bacterium]|nr:SH3 domain-containing protein [Acidobacteriota bacterium]
MKSKLLLFLFFGFGAFVLSGCTSVASLVVENQKCVVIAKRAHVRSSGAVVAADVLEVTRGQTLEVLDEMTYENEKWYNVRASDEEQTEGWIEARYVITQNLLEKSQKLAEEDREIPAQAAGQLRAASNLRLSPDRTKDENILVKLLGGDTFEIVGWKRVPKTDDAEKDDAPKGGTDNQANKNGNSPQRQKDNNAPLQLDDKYETWYKVRLDPSVSPAPAGWIYGKQVELAVPPDIIFYRTGREFVAWRRLDGDEGASSSFLKRGKDMAREDKPGSWVILEKSNILQEPDGEEPDFDRILVLGYDKYNQDHYKVYRSGNVKGFLPLRLTGTGDSRVFSVRLKNGEGQLIDVQFQVFKDARGNLKVKVPDNIPKDEKRGD